MSPLAKLDIDVMIIAVAATLGSLFSAAFEINYALHWNQSRTDQWIVGKLALQYPGLAFGTLSLGANSALQYCVYYTFNVIVLGLGLW